MYADRKKWPLKDVTVKLNHAKVHAEDCEGCEKGNKRIDSIERVISLEGPLDQSQKTRLMEIADRCPVHRTLNSEIRIETEFEG
jgi:putative redox protein